MKELPLSRIAQWANGRLRGDDALIEAVSTDTRTLQAGEGSATLYEGWWPRQFAAGKGVNELTSSAVNPIHEVHFVGNMWSPSTGWKDCRCEVRKVTGATDG